MAAADREPFSESRPVPDPTALTTAQTEREIAALRQLIEAKNTGTTAAFDARLEGMDKAIKLLQAIQDRFPEFVQQEVKHLRELHQEKFESIATRFTENKVAVDAALSASEKAASKTEANTTKLIDGIYTLNSQTKAASDDKVDDLRNRITVVESAKKTGTEVTGAIFGYIFGAAGFIAALVSVIVFVLKANS